LQREDYVIMDDQYFSFEALSKIYSIKDLLRLYFIRCPPDNAYVYKRSKD